MLEYILSLFIFQEKCFLQMVRDAGSPGIQRHFVRPEALRSMETCYEQALAELGKLVKVKAKLQSCLRPYCQVFQTWTKPILQLHE